MAPPPERHAEPAIDPLPQGKSMSRETVQIAFGRGHLTVALPDGARPTLIRKRQLPKLPDPHAAVRAALDAGRLRELARGKRSACILICDITRPVPNHLFLRPMIEDMIGGRNPARRHHGAGRDRTASARTRAPNCANSSATPGCCSTFGSRTTSPATTTITSISA